MRRGSSRSTDTGARPRALATYNPPNPPPTMTTRCDGAVSDITASWMLSAGLAMLLGARGAVPVRILAYSPGFVLYFRFGRTEPNHDARNSTTGRGHSGRGAHRHCHPQTQRHQEEGRRRFLVHSAPGRFLLLVCAAACSSAADPPALVSRIRQHMREYVAHLPDYTCRITLERSARPKARAAWQPRDRLRLAVAYTGGQELYSWPGEARFQGGIEDLLPGHGMVSNGSYALHVDRKSTRLNSS